MGNLVEQRLFGLAQREQFRSLRRLRLGELHLAENGSGNQDR